MRKQIAFLTVFLISLLAFAQPGSIDHTFNPDDLGFGHGDGPDDYVFAMAKQSDGKILIGGDFTTYNNISRYQIARIHPDGTLDHTFDPGEGFSYSNPSQIFTIEILLNGKILVGGRFNNYNGQAVNNLIQLNPDGSMDQTFNSGTGPNQTVSAIRQQPDGRILIGGQFTSYNGVDVSNLARLHQDGSLDNSFQGPDYGFNYFIHEILVLPDEKYLVGGRFAYAGGTSNHYIVRLLSDGSLDSTFNTNFTPLQFVWGFEEPFIKSIVVMDNNKYLIAGRLKIPDLDNFKSIIRLNEDGTLDEDFEMPEVTPTYSFHPFAEFILPLPQDKYLIGGAFSAVNGLPYTGFAVINSNGTLDTLFNPADVGLFLCAVQPDEGKLVLSTYDFNYGNLLFARVNEDFTIDPAFNPVTGANARVKSIHVLSDQKILMIGNFRFYNGIPVNGIIRIMPDGSPDASFNPLVEVPAGNQFYAIIEQDNGKVLAGGIFWDPVNNAGHRLVRLNSNGSLDQSFNIGSGANGNIYDIKIQSDEKIIVAGDFTMLNSLTANRIVRIDQDGNIDKTFNTVHGANRLIRCVKLQPDEKILIGGRFFLFDSIPRSRIARLNTDGGLDMDFDPGHGFQSYDGVNNPVINAIGLQQDGKIIVTGNFLMFNDAPVKRIVRLNQDGSLDTTFNPGYGANDEVESMAIQPDGKIILTGNFTMFDSIPANRIVRLNEDGGIDTTFITGSGSNGIIRDVAIHEHEKIIIAGDFTAYNGTGRNRIARIMGDESTGVRNVFKTASIKIYPNPAQDFVYIEADRYLQGASIRLYDLQGRIVDEQINANGQLFQLRIGNQKPGVYIVEIQHDEFVGRQKLIRH